MCAGPARRDATRECRCVSMAGPAFLETPHPALPALRCDGRPRGGGESLSSLLSDRRGQSSVRRRWNFWWRQVMVGQIRYVNGDAYVQVNDSGTLERLPPIKWYKQMYLHMLSFLGKLHLEDVRKAWR